MSRTRYNIFGMKCISIRFHFFNCALEDMNLHKHRQFADKRLQTNDAILHRI